LGGFVNKAFRQQKTGGQLEIVAGGAHRDGQRVLDPFVHRSVPDPNFQGLFYRQQIGFPGQVLLPEFIYLDE
jgi:hypothetical protein